MLIKILTISIISGDFNANYKKGRFWEELLNVISNNSLCVSDAVLPDDTFTYLCPGRSTVSWLDHILSSDSIKLNISNIAIRHDLALFDHFPIVFKLNVDMINTKVCNESNFSQFVNWKLFLSNDVTLKYKKDRKSVV